MDNEINDYRYEKLKDQLTPSTRNVRRNLLAAASISIVLVLINSKIDGLLGIKFDENVPIYIPLGALYFVVLYEFITFIFYGTIDFKSWRLKPFEKTHQFTESKLQNLTSNLSLLSKKLARNDLKNINLGDIGGHPVPTYFEPPMPIDPVHLHVDPMHFDHITGGVGAEEWDKFVDAQQNSLLEVVDTHQQKIASMVESQEKSLEKIVQAETKNFKRQISLKLGDANKLIDLDISNFQNALDTANDEIQLFKNEVEKYQKGIKSFNMIQRVRIYVIDWGTPLLLGGLSLYLNFDSLILFTKEISSRVLGG